MLLNSRQFKFLKNYRNVNVKSSAKREYRDENVFRADFFSYFPDNLGPCHKNYTRLYKNYGSRSRGLVQQIL